MDLNTPPNPLSQIPSSAPLTKKHRHTEFFILTIAVIIIAAGIIWWQIGKLADESEFATPITSITPNLENREISNLNSDVQNVDTGNLDSEFQQVDNDLNSL
jgi:hypothetical protein